MRYVQKQTNCNTNIEHFNKVFISKNAEDPILGVEVEVSATEEVATSNKPKAAEEAVKEHIREPGHTGHLHILIQIYRANRRQHGTSITQHEPLPRCHSEILSCLVIEYQWQC